MVLGKTLGIKKSASIAPCTAPRTVVDTSFINVLHPYCTRGCRGCGGLKRSLQPTKKAHTISRGLQQKCFTQTKEWATNRCCSVLHDHFSATFLVTIDLRQSCLTAPRAPRVGHSQRSELAHATIVPQRVVVADSEDELSLIRVNAAGTATPVGITACYWSTRKTGG